MSFLMDQDPEVAKAIELEDLRQRDSIVLIASENYASKAVLEAQSGVMNKKVCRRLSRATVLWRM
ncbi:MAG: hypothetical protein CM1200mP15_17830 [Dehalococcoidia bacterium]|nr:MAG: hypothetical protein CM1200mP15_17830 [Dehalococcoidia bacterium]